MIAQQLTFSHLATLVVVATIAQHIIQAWRSARHEETEERKETEEQRQESARLNRQWNALVAREQNLNEWQKSLVEMAATLAASKEQKTDP